MFSIGAIDFANILSRFFSNQTSSFEDFINNTQTFTDTLVGQQQMAANEIEDIVEKFKSLKGLEQTIADAYCGGGINLQEVSSQLLISQSNADIAMNIYNFLRPAGIIMLVLYFLLDVQNELTSRMREFSVRNIVQSIMKILIGIVLLGYGPRLMGAIIDVSNNLIYQICAGNILGGTVDSVDMTPLYITVMNVLVNASFLQKIGFALNAGIITIAQLLPEFVILLQAISRKIEVILRVGLAPISLPDIYNGAANSRAVTYLKKLAAALIHGMIMIAVVKIAYSLEQDFIVSMFTGLDGTTMPNTKFFIQLCLYSWASAGLIASSKQIINDAMGA